MLMNIQQCLLLAVQLMTVAVSVTAQISMCPPPRFHLTTGDIQFPKRPEYKKMDKVRKPHNPKCKKPSLEIL